MNAGTEPEHIFTPGERAMRDSAQHQLEAAARLLNEPLQREDVRQALRNARAATAALEYLERRATGCAEPQRG